MTVRRSIIGLVVGQGLYRTLEAFSVIQSIRNDANQSLRVPFCEQVCSLCLCVIKSKDIPKLNMTWIRFLDLMEMIMDVFMVYGSGNLVEVVRQDAPHPTCQRAQPLGVGGMLRVTGL